MLKIILLGWVVGIALMGINLPLIMQYGKVGKALLLLAFLFYLFKRSVFVSRPFLKAMYSLLCAASFFCCGVSICRECVGRTLTTKRNGFKKSRYYCLYKSTK